jgi:ABC-type phosphate transport system substrate-binding protein
VIIVIFDSSKGKKYMDIAVRKRFIMAPLVALLIGLSAVCCMVFAETSSAAVPAGINCQASDGKISGRGSTYQNVLLKEYAKVYGEDYCGSVAEQFTGDPAGSNMVAYNYPAAVSGSGTGSGAGIQAASCRTDAFAGTDIPYEQKQLEQLDGATGATGGCAITFAPPFEPKASPFPNANDIPANLMALPVGGSAAAVAIKFTFGTETSTCPTSTALTVPKSLVLTPKEVSRIYGGDAQKWNDAELLVNNGGATGKLSKCTGAITRVVRFDKSGTTNILKQYLIRVDNARTGAVCKGNGNPATPLNWETYFATNTEWPGKQHEGLEGECSKIITAGVNGGPALVTKLKETAGGVGYVDLAEAGGNGFVLASVENATGTAFEGPSNGEAANCNFGALSLPGSTTSDAVGLLTTDDWSNNNEKLKTEGGNEKENHENATDIGSQYPICGLTFDLVYSGLHANNAEGKSANSRLTTDQRRTLYSYMTFILSSAGQSVPPTIHYSSLPEAWVSKLSQGFQENF